MQAHELAKRLLAGPNLPVVINGWGSDEGFTFEVSEPLVDEMTFNGVGDTVETPRDDLGYTIPRPCVALHYGWRALLHPER